MTKVCECGHRLDEHEFDDINEYMRKDLGCLLCDCDYYLEEDNE